MGRSRLSDTKRSLLACPRFQGRKKKITPLLPGLWTQGGVSEGRRAVPFFSTVNGVFEDDHGGGQTGYGVIVLEHRAHL